MTKKQFKISLKDVAQKDGRTAYAVAKQLGLNQNTVRKYLTEDVVTDFIPFHVTQIMELYGLDWRNTSAIQIIDVEDHSSGQLKTPLAAFA